MFLRFDQFPLCFGKLGQSLTHHHLRPIQVLDVLLHRRLCLSHVGLSGSEHFYDALDTIQTVRAVTIRHVLQCSRSRGYTSKVCSSRPFSANTTSAGSPISSWRTPMSRI